MDLSAGRDCQTLDERTRRLGAARCAADKILFSPIFALSCPHLSNFKTASKGAGPYREFTECKDMIVAL
jgi:hypothetical protein